ncbi:MAG: DUF2911 domain-containing protein [Candidatus Acidiferrales bacterium]
MRRFLLCCSAIVFSVGVLAVHSMAQQDKSQRPSPPAQTEFHFADGKTVTVDYSSPRAKGRKIFGGLVPYGEVWRAGANEATTFVTDTAVTVGGKTVPAGAYTLFAIPSQDKWTLIVSKVTKNAKGAPLWGTDYPGEVQDLLRVDMKVSPLPAAVENFTIALDKVGNGAALRMDWEQTRASVEIAEAK